MDLPRIAALLAPFLGGVTLAGGQLSQLSAYLDLLLRWNARVNLTAVRDPEQIVSRHFGESLFTAGHLFPHRPLATDHWLLDLGSGAGFPGLPIKIWAPALRVTLIESQHRKATFLREVVRALALSATDVFPGRAEDFDLRKLVGTPLSLPVLEQGGEVDSPDPNLGSMGPGALAGAAADSPQDHLARAPSPATADAPITNRQSPIANLTITLRAVERFENILPIAARLLAASPSPTHRLALLIGEAQLPRARRLVPTLTWSDPIPVPQSSHRVLLIGTGGSVNLC